MATQSISRAWVMRIGDEQVCVSPQELKEVVEITQPKTLPLAPAAILGLIGVRGSVLPLVDYGELSQKPTEGPFQGAVVQVGESTFALAINEIVGIYAWSPENGFSKNLGQFGLERMMLHGSEVTRLDLGQILKAIGREVEDGHLVSR